MKHPRRRDENEDAAEIVRRSTASRDELPKGLEAAWADWSSRIQGIDERTMTLMKAAFEAGAAAVERISPAAQLGRLGAKQGGLARAAKLTDSRRKAIAKKAARARWTRTTPQVKPVAKSGSKPEMKSKSQNPD